MDGAPQNDLTMPRNILLTGPPGSGKTTLLLHTVEALAGITCCGFVTVEIRERGRRVGFSLRGFHGELGLLAHVDRPGTPRVGKYGVAVEEFEAFLDRIDLHDPSCDLIVIDEIGKMECLSERFVALVEEVLDAPTPVVATIARTGGGAIGRIRSRDDVEILDVTRATREECLRDLIGRIRTGLRG